MLRGIVIWGDESVGITLVLLLNSHFPHETYRITKRNVRGVNGQGSISGGRESSRATSDDVEWIPVQVVRMVDEAVHIIDNNITTASASKNMVSDHRRVDRTAIRERE